MKCFSHICWKNYQKYVGKNGPYVGKSDVIVQEIGKNDVT